MLQGRNVSDFNQVTKLHSVKLTFLPCSIRYFSSGFNWKGRIRMRAMARARFIIFNQLMQNTRCTKILKKNLKNVGKKLKKNNYLSTFFPSHTYECDLFNWNQEKIIVCCTRGKSISASVKFAVFASATFTFGEIDFPPGVQHNILFLIPFYASLLTRNTSLPSMLLVFFSAQDSVVCDELNVFDHCVLWWRKTSLRLDEARNYGSP